MGREHSLLHSEGICYTPSHSDKVSNRKEECVVGQMKGDPCSSRTRLSELCSCASVEWRAEVMKTGIYLELFLS